MRTLIATIAVASATALAGTRDEGVPDEKYLAEGKQYRHLVGEISGEVNPMERYKGTCVVFDPHHVLTAAHVIDGCRDIHVQMPDGCIHKVTLSAKCPEFTRTGIGFGDIAVCRVRERFRCKKFPPLGSCEPAPKEVVVAGYGFAGSMADGRLVYDGNLRAGSNQISRLTDGLAVCQADRRGSRLEYHIESGDSGGPLFDDCGRIIGIHSSTLRDIGKSPSRYGDESAHTRVDRFREWIEEVVRSE